LLEAHPNAALRLDNSVLVDESELEPDKVGVGSMVEIEGENGDRMEARASAEAERFRPTRRSAVHSSGAAKETPST
jgi:hypothetical protein